MATEIRVPTLGESVTEATIGKWFKKVGDAIAADEPLVELETDKVTIEVPAPAAGTLSEIAAKDGETVGVGALLGQIAAGGGPPSRRRRTSRRSEAAKPEAVAQAAGAAGAATVKEAARRPRQIAGDTPDRRAQDAAGAGRRQAARREPMSRSTRWPAPASAARC